MSEYAERDIDDLEPHYSTHVSAMTSEELHKKRDIAAELAYRDKRIEQLEARVKELETELFRIRTVNTLAKFHLVKEAGDEQANNS